MAKQLNVNLAMTADTSKAKAELQSLQKQLNDLMLSAQKNDSSLGLSKDIQHATQMAAQLKVQLEAATGSTGKLDLTKFNDQLRKSKTSIQDYQKALTSLGPAGTQAFSNLASSIMQAEVPLRRANKALDEFATSLANTARWQLSSSILHGFMGAIQGAYRYAQDLNESLNNIRIVTGNSTEQMSKFALEANKAAKALSTTTTSYTDAALIYYQQGLSEKEVKARTDATIKMANVSRQSAEEVSSQMTAIWNNFAKGGEDLEYYADVITKLGAATASSSDEIAQGLQKFAAVADTVGLSYEKATAALATVVAETRQSADVVGTAFKTMFARFQGLQLGETLEDGVGLNKYSAALAKVGVQILDANGDLKNMDIILDDIAERWNNISNAQQVALAETVAGTRQYAQFMAIMNNYDKILANQKLGASSRGTLNQQAEIYAESWEAAEKRVKAAAQGIYDDLISDDFFITMLNGFEKALGAVDNFIKGIGGLPSLLMLIGNLVTQIFNKQISNSIQSMADSFRNLRVGAEDAKKLRQETVNELLNLNIVKNPKTNEQMGYSAAIKNQAYASQALLDNANRMTEAEKAQFQILMDINKQYGQEVIQLGKIADLAKKDADEAERKAHAQIYNQIDINEYKQVSENLKSLRKDVENLPKISEILLEGAENANPGGTYDGPRAYLENLKNQLSELGKGPLVQDAIQRIGDLLDGDPTWDQTKLQLEALNEVFSENSIKEKIENIIPQNITNRTEIINNLTTAFTKEGKAVQDVKDGVDGLTNSTEGLQGSMDKLNDRIPTTAEQIVTISNYAMGLLTIFRSFSNLKKIWSDESLSDGERMIQIFSSLSMVIPVVTALTNKDTQASITHAGAKIAEAFATEKAAAANLSFMASLGIITGIIIAVGLAIYGVVKAFQALHAASPEGQLEAAKKATEEATKAAEEAKTAYEKLKSTIENYQSAKDKIKSLEKGTDEFKEAIKEANEQALILINTYKNLPFTVDENGMISFKSDDLQRVQQEAYQQQVYTQNSVYAMQLSQAKKQNVVDKEDFYNKMSEQSGSFGVGFYDSFYVRSHYTNENGDYDSRAFFDAVANLQKELGAFSESNKSEIAERLFGKNLTESQEDYVQRLIDSNLELDNLVKTVDSLNDTLNSVSKSAMIQAFLLNDDYNNSQNKAALLNIAQENFEQEYNYASQQNQNKTGKELALDYAKNSGYLWNGKDKNGEYTFFINKQGNTVTFTTEDLREQANINGALNNLSGHIGTNDNQINLLKKQYGSELTTALLTGDYSNIAYNQFGNIKEDKIRSIASNLGLSGDKVWTQFATAANRVQNNGLRGTIDASNATGTDIENYRAARIATVNKLESSGIRGFYGTIRNIESSNNTIEGLTQFYEGLQNINLAGYNAAEQIYNLAESCGLSKDSVEDLVEQTKDLPKQVDTSTESLQAQAAEIGEIIGKGLKLGDIITSEQGDKLEAAGVQIGDYFATMADGTLKLVGDAEAFAAAARGVIISGYQNKQKEMGNAKLANGEWDLAQFSDQFAGNATYEAAIGGDPEAYAEMQRILTEQYKQLGDNALYATGTLEEYNDVIAHTVTSEQAQNDQLNLLLPQRINEAKSLDDLINLYSEYGDKTDAISKKIAETANASIEEADSFQKLAEIMNIVDRSGAKIDEGLLDKKLHDVAIAGLEAASSLQEYDAALSEAEAYGVELTEREKAEALIKLGSAYENCANQIRAYRSALNGGKNTDQAKDALRAAIAVNDLAKKYSLDAKTLEAHARAIKENNKAMELSEEEAVQLAARNERMNAGVKTLSSNWEDWSKTLKEAKNTSMDFASVAAKVEDVLKDFAGLDGDFELDQEFFNSAHNMKLLEEAARGSQAAINELSVIAGKMNLAQIFDSVKDSIHGTDEEIEAAREDIVGFAQNILDNFNAIESGAKSFEDVIAGGTKNFVDSFNKMALAAKMSKDEVNKALAAIGVKANVKMTRVSQWTQVPIYRVEQQPFNQSTWVSDGFEDGLEVGHYSNATGYHQVTTIVGYKNIKGFVDVATINAGDPNIQRTEAGGGEPAGGVSASSIAPSGGTKSGGGGGSSPTRSTKQHAQPSSNPYQGIEKQIDRLNSQYNKLERARKRAYGEGALSIIKQEIEKTKELANAQRDYIKAIAGDQGLNFAKIIEQGGDLGAAIKAAGGGGGQLGKAYKELLYGKNDAFEITMKDSDGNETTVSKSTSGIGMDIKISSTGVIENYNELEQHIYDKYNAEVDWWNKLSADEQQDPNNIARMEAAEKTRDIELDQLSTVQDQLDVLWDQSDKLAEIRDGLYDLNYSLLSEKIHLKVDIAERQLKFLQYQIKILGDNIYKIPEAMNKLFGGGDSVYGKLQNLANTWKDAFYEAQSLYGLDPEQGGISAADYADMIKQAQDGLYNVIDQLLDMNEQMRNYYKKALQGVLNEMQAITNQMEHQVSIVSHLRNILSLLGRETDWTAMTGLIQGQMHMQHNNYQVSRQQAAMLKGEVQHAYANLADIQASGASEDAVNEFKQAVLQPAIEAAIQAEEKMYSDLEAFIQSINDLFDVFKNKALSEFEDAITGIYGSFDYLNSSMERAQSIADEYLTTTNKLYETNELMRKLAQDMDKTDSAYAKRKLKNFSDEIQQLQNREKLTKSEMDFAKARYELLLAEIALTEAQNAKSTVRLQRDNEGNYGYVYTADRDAVDNAEQNLVEKQNNLYNLALEKYNEYSQKLIQLNSEEKAALDELWTQYKEGSIASWDEYLFKRNEIVDQYDQQREALSITYYEAQKILDETAATDYHEAWASSYEAVVEKSIDSHNEITDLINEMDGTLHWLDSERAAITAEAQLDTQGMIATVGQLTAENDKLAAEMVNNVIPKAQALLSTVNDLTAAWAKQYDQIMALIQEYMDLIAVMQQALEALAAEQNQNQQMQDSFDYNKDYSLEMFKTYNDQTAYLQAMRDRERKIGDLGMNQDQFVFDTATTKAIIDQIYKEGQQSWFTDTMNSSFRNIQKGLEQNIDDEFLRKLKSIVPGFATGGYTGDFNGGKLAFLHQKELVLNEADTENILASVKIIRQIADAIGLRAAAANTESSISPGFISNQGALEQSVTIHAEFPNATNHGEIEEAFASLINRATQFAGRISANTDRE